MPQGRPFLNRIFAIVFAVICLIFAYYFATAWDPAVARKEVIPLAVSFLVVVVGLLIEVWKPSLDFTFHRDRKLIFFKRYSAHSFCFAHCWAYTICSYRRLARFAKLRKLLGIYNFSALVLDGYYIANCGIFRSGLAADKSKP